MVAGFRFGEIRGTRYSSQTKCYKRTPEAQLDALCDQAPDLQKANPSRHRTLRAVDTRLVFLGDDPDGVALEVIAVEPDNELLVVIHAMKMRPRYKTRYEEARRWQK